MLVLIRGAGDIATGIAMRLWRTGVQVVMTDLPQPTAIRRTGAVLQIGLAAADTLVCAGWAGLGRKRNPEHHRPATP